MLEETMKEKKVKTNFFSRKKNQEKGKGKNIYLFILRIVGFIQFNTKEIVYTFKKKQIANILEHNLLQCQIVMTIL
jgi:hypothetical protein